VPVHIPAALRCDASVGRALSERHLWGLHLPYKISPGVGFLG
jgi:hypothetical protein